MQSWKSSVILLTSLISLTVICSEAADPTYLYHVCSNTTTFTRNSTYQSNLNILLSSLSSNATSSNGFYNASAGQDPDDVYGLFLCRGDDNINVCQDCVTFATQDIVQRCPIEKVAIIWYDECLLRYSNKSIFSDMDDSLTVYLSNTQNITDQGRFNQLLATTMDNIASQAAAAPSGLKKFAVEEANFTAFQKLYTLVQCTPDLSSSDCNRCLQIAISQLPSCCSGKQGGRVLSPSCNIRFEVYPFYNATAVAKPPSPAALPLPPPGKNRISTITIAVIVIAATVSVSLFCLGYHFLRRRAKKKYNVTQEDSVGSEITTMESLQFEFGTIEAATRKFSDDNKLGEGGFGEVYKGKLPNGQEIAVKRLSRSSGQGGEEFKNEVMLVAKLQHRNLVRLLGFCLQGEEKILVYEFVPNKSLDYLLFDPQKQGQLDWSTRYKIIGGIARGILYLHEDSRIRIIHRDLKASNILLDRDMNPKISDFGVARLFGVDQTQGNTSRIVGTYGYMSPEYAMHGHFSIKSDVYSFGVLILEIISGQKINSFYQSDGANDLVSYVWENWREGTPLEVMDPTLTDSYSKDEVIRCIHMGLLCVQEDAAARPTMATVVLMLSTYSVTLPLPQKPAFFLRNRTEPMKLGKELESGQSTSKSVAWSVDEESITEVFPR